MVVEAEGRESRADLLSRLVPGRKKEEDVEPAPEEAPVAHESGGVPRPRRTCPATRTVSRRLTGRATTTLVLPQVARTLHTPIAGVGPSSTWPVWTSWWPTWPNTTGRNPRTSHSEAMVDVKRSADGNYVARIAWNPQR